MWRAIIPLGLAAAMAACGLPANVVVLVPEQNGIVGKVLVASNGAQNELAAPYAAVGTGTATRSGDVFIANRQVVEEEFAGALAATPRTPDVYVIFFLLGQAEVDPRSFETLKVAIDAARKTRNADISVVGHTDAIGDESENRALSLQRAQAIRDALVKGGVAPSTIEIGYHGSNNPRVPTPRGVPEPENRRVEVTIR
jgi:outer membrane protein OmpA-like peptidoglycan-associated protein